MTEIGVCGVNGPMRRFTKVVEIGKTTLSCAFLVRVQRGHVRQVLFASSADVAYNKPALLFGTLWACCVGI